MEMPFHGLPATAVPTGILDAQPQILKNHKKPPPSPTSIWTLFLPPHLSPYMKGGDEIRPSLTIR